MASSYFNIDPTPKSWDPDYKPGQEGLPSWNESFGKPEPKDDGGDRGKEFLKAFAGALNPDSSSKYREQAESFKPTFGQSNEGRTNQVLEGLGALYPQQHAPVYMPGVQGESFGGAIGGALGAIGGALIPGVGPALGASIGGGVGRFF